MSSTTSFREGSTTVLGENPASTAGFEGAAHASEPRVLPAVQRMRARIDKVFSRYVGPIAGELCAEEFDRWRWKGQVGPSGLHRYIARLVRYVPDDAQRREFIRDASRCIDVGLRPGG